MTRLYDLILCKYIHVYIFACGLDCIGIGIHAFHMHCNILGLLELVHDISLEEKGSEGSLKMLSIGG